MTIIQFARSAAVGGSLWLALAAMPAQAVLVSTNVSGALSAANNGCTAAEALNSDDCSYNASDPVNGSASEWIGPVFQSGYYAPGGAPGADATPTPGDGKAALGINGSFTITDNGDGFGSNDLISFSLTLDAGTENANGGSGTRIQYSWSSITWMMPFTAVDAVTPNMSGGNDYVIGSAGFPTLLVDDASGTDFFPSETASTSSVLSDGSYWAAPAALGVAFFEGNLGGAPGISATGWSCAAGSDGASCAGRSVTTEQIWNNLLLFLSTDALGNVLSVAGFGVAERDLSAAYSGIDSWDSDYLTLTGAAAVPLPAGAWLMLSALGALVSIRRKKAGSAA